MRFAIPLANGLLCNHFGHCELFAIVKTDGNRIKEKKLLPPPPHEPGVIPRWLKELGVEVVIAGGMGARAMGMFQQMGIEVITGAPIETPESLVENYMNRTLEVGPNVCDH
jgi:predicted Fe-Mo cluster-binding NifX family protein